MTKILKFEPDPRVRARIQAMERLGPLTADDFQAQSLGRPASPQPEPPSPPAANTQPPRGRRYWPDRRW